MKNGIKSRKLLFRFLSLLLVFSLMPVLPVSAITREDVEEGILLPKGIRKESSRAGEITAVEYVNCYGFPLHAGIYLPAGYDENGCYDVIFLWPGTLCGYEEVLQFQYPCYFEDGGLEKLSTAELLDRMIEQRIIRPVILVCMEDIGNINVSHAELDLGIMLDYVKANYPTYASREGITQEELRKHFALVGFSQGSIFAQSAGMGFLYDDFASFAAISYGFEWGVLESVNSSPYELSLLYAGFGNRADNGAADSMRCYDIIVNGCGDKIRDGENAFLRRWECYNHSYSMMLAAMYDYLPMMVPSEKTRLMELYYGGYSPRRNS